MISKIMISHISNQTIPLGKSVKFEEIREGIRNLIGLNFPGFESDKSISLDVLNQYRRKYLTSLIVEERGELAQIDLDVMQAIQSNSILSENMQDYTEEKNTFGDKLADQIATFGGSWTFIIFFFSFIMLWIGSNIFLSHKII